MIKVFKRSKNIFLKSFEDITVVGRYNKFKILFINQNYHKITSPVSVWRQKIRVFFLAKSRLQFNGNPKTQEKDLLVND